MPGTYYTKKRPKMKAKPIKRDKSRDSEMTKINEYLDNLKLPKKISNSSLTKISAEYNKKKTKSKRKSPKKSKSVRKSPKKSKSVRKSPKKTKSKRKSPKKSKRKVTNVGMKIKKLMKEGYPHKQAVAIALSMEKSNKLGPRGGYKKSPKRTKSKSTAALVDTDSEDEMEFLPNPPGRKRSANNPSRKKMSRPRSVKKESAVKKSSVRPRGRPPKGKKWNGTKYVVELPIQPTAGESLFETYLAILTDILGVEEIYQGLIDYYNEEKETDIKLITKDKENDRPEPRTDNNDPLIYKYTPRLSGDTHFRVYKHDPNATLFHRKWVVVDPYDLYQKPRTQGFCQMFAYFIATDNTDEFIMVNREDSEDNKKIVYRKNTYLCLRKVLQLINAIKEKPKPDLIQKMEEGFQDCKDYKDEEDPTKEFGIVDKSMTFEDFIKNLGDFKEESVQKYIDDLYDK